MKRIFLAPTVLLFAVTAFAQDPKPGDPPRKLKSQMPDAPLISPEVASDGRVTFRLRAPNIQKASVSVEGKSLTMQKDDRGIWTVTSEPLAPDYYGYEFSLDEVGMLDPSNYRVIPNFLYRSSEVHVPRYLGKSQTFPTARFIITFINQKSSATIATSTFTLRPITIPVENKHIPFCIFSMATATMPAPGPRSVALTSYSII